MVTVTAEPAATLVDVDLAQISTEGLEAGICGFAARLAAATCVFVLAIAEYDRRRGWESWECRSMAHWLTWKAAMGPVAAREHVRVGAALGGLGVVRDRFSAGALSYSQVRAITRVATPATEADLVELAGTMTAAQLETLVRAYRRARLDVTDPDRAPYARRGLAWHTDDDGSLVGTFRLAPEDGAVLTAALQAAADRFDLAGSQGGDGDGDPTLDRPAARRADALVALSGAYLDHPDTDTGTGEVADRYLINIIAERPVLTAAADEHPDAVCAIDNGPGLAPDTVRRLACDNPTVTIIEDQYGHVLDIGRKTRRINRALRRALARRDGGCQYPGCGTRRSQAHHIIHWIDGGPTNLNNLISLCNHHHHRHHHGAYTINPTPTGNWIFTRADGRPITPAATPPAGPVGADPGIEPAATTTTPDWDGTSLDLSGIVDSLLRQENLVTETPPPTPWPDTWHDPWTPHIAWPGER